MARIVSHAGFLKKDKPIEVKEASPKPKAKKATTKKKPVKKSK